MCSHPGTHSTNLDKFSDNTNTVLEGTFLQPAVAFLRPSVYFVTDSPPSNRKDYFLFRFLHTSRANWIHAQNGKT